MEANGNLGADALRGTVAVAEPLANPAGDK